MPLQAAIVSVSISTLRVPTIETFETGAAVPIPTLSFVASMLRVVVEVGGR